MPVRAVVFDIGGVLFDWDIRYLYRKLVADPATLDWLLTHVITPTWHHQHDLGRDFADTSAELSAQFPDQAALIQIFEARFAETIGEAISGMHALVAEIDEAGIPLFCITNFSHEFFPPFRARHQALFDRFRSIVVSGDVKLAKPDPAIYALSLAQFGLAPGEGFFIDDRLDNIESANRCGLIGHHFTGVAGVREQLDALGIKL